MYMYMHFEKVMNECIHVHYAGLSVFTRKGMTCIIIQSTYSHCQMNK